MCVLTLLSFNARHNSPPRLATSVTLMPGLSRLICSRLSFNHNMYAERGRFGFSAIFNLFSVDLTRLKSVNEILWKNHKRLVYRWNCHVFSLKWTRHKYETDLKQTTTTRKIKQRCCRVDPQLAMFLWVYWRATQAKPILLLFFNLCSHCWLGSHICFFKQNQSLFLPPHYWSMAIKKNTSKNFHNGFTRFQIIEGKMYFIFALTHSPQSQNEKKCRHNEKMGKNAFIYRNHI